MSRKRNPTDAVADFLAAFIFYAIVFAILGLLLAGCATAKAPEKVFIPLAKACVPDDVPQAPAHYSDHDLGQTSDPAERMRKVGAANLERKARLAVVEPVLAACR